VASNGPFELACKPGDGLLRRRPAGLYPGRCGTPVTTMRISCVMKCGQGRLPANGRQGISSIQMSPSGKLLAVGGRYGLELYHFNGSKPIAPYRTLLSITKDSKNTVISGFGWDNDNHLYAFGASSGSNPYKLEILVYNPTPTSVGRGTGFTLRGGRLSYLQQGGCAVFDKTGRLSKEGT
jgi:hypothetical protein